MTQRSDAPGFRLVEGRTRDDLPTFGSAAALVRWHFGRGRDGMGGLKAIQPRADRIDNARDFWSTSTLHARFAGTTKAVAVVTDPAEQVVIVRCVVEGRPMEHAARELAVLRLWFDGQTPSRTTVKRIERRALRRVEALGRKLGVIE